MQFRRGSCASPEPGREASEGGYTGPTLQGTPAPPTDPHAFGWAPPVSATGPRVPLWAESGAGVGVGRGRGPQAAWRTRDKEPGVRGCAGNASSERPGPALSIQHAAKPTRSISWAAERAQAGHSPEEHARAEVGVLQRVGFHLGMHGQHLARGARDRAAAPGSAGEDAGAAAAAPVRSAGASQAGSGFREPRAGPP